jgi:hypothetical protein
MRGPVLALCALLALSGLALAGGSPSCVGFAPLLSDCDLGTHPADTRVRVLFPACGAALGAALPDPADGPCFAGDVVLRLAGSNGARTFVCSVLAPPAEAINPSLVCSGSGTFPSGAVRITCHARAYGTGMGGPAGAVGAWGCATA